MVLIDTSVWIDLLKDKHNPSVDKCRYILENNIVFGINYLIYMELLNGSKSIKEYNLIKEYLDDMKFYDLKSRMYSYANISKLYISCRRKGVTIRSLIDLIIAQTAIENDLYLLHNDKDYEYMSKVIHDLKFY